MPGPLTSLSAEQLSLVGDYSNDAAALGRVAQRLLMPQGDAFGGGLSEQRMAERNTRPATELLRRAMELDPSGLSEPRDDDNRVVGSCRHYAVLTTAMLRANGLPARARCGFASYFVPDKHVDHWVTEYWNTGEKRWVRIDTEILGLDVVARPEDLAADQFMSGGEAWQQTRGGANDAMDFGVTGTPNWGPGEIRGNVMRDVAALMKIEMLPWDEWGSMAASYNGETDAEFDRLMDRAAASTASDDRAELELVYAELAVPAEMIV